MSDYRRSGYRQAQYTDSRYGNAGYGNSEYRGNDMYQEQAYGQQDMYQRQTGYEQNSYDYQQERPSYSRVRRYEAVATQNYVPARVSNRRQNSYYAPAPRRNAQPQGGYGYAQGAAYRPVNDARMRQNQNRWDNPDRQQYGAPRYDDVGYGDNAGYGYQEAGYDNYQQPQYEQPQYNSYQNQSYYDTPEDTHQREYEEPEEQTEEREEGKSKKQTILSRIIAFASGLLLIAVVWIIAYLKMNGFISLPF